MPELPEVECVRRSLERLIVGRRVESVRVTRRDVIRGPSTPTALLLHDRIDHILRHGKQLALVGGTGRCVCVHLGMSGQLCVLPAGDSDQRKPSPIERPNPRSSSNGRPLIPPHTHVLWCFEGGSAMRFTDPRRFGGLWTFAQVDALASQRWSALGPDALSITPAELCRRLSSTRRALKAALLDQALVAGLGNIYVDELLFGAGLHPLTPADTIDRALASSLVRRMRTLLTGAIKRGGSSLRDYVDAENQRGSQQDRHRVYGRSGERCRRRSCSANICSDQIAGRTTAWCPGCQFLP